MCSECGRPFSVRMRAYRKIRVGERLPVCHLCSYDVPLVITDELRLFWLERFEMDEILQVAEHAWGPRKDWGDGWRDGFEFLPTRIPGL
jgi:hypothetical protein